MVKIYLDVVGSTASAYSREMERYSALADEAEMHFPHKLLKSLKAL